MEELPRTGEIVIFPSQPELNKLHTNLGFIHTQLLGTKGGPEVDGTAFSVNTEDLLIFSNEPNPNNIKKIFDLFVRQLQAYTLFSRTLSPDERNSVEHGTFIANVMNLRTDSNFLLDCYKGTDKLSRIAKFFFPIWQHIFHRATIKSFNDLQREIDIIHPEGKQISMIERITKFISRCWPFK